MKYSYEIREAGKNFIFCFSSKARSSVGVLNSFVKKFPSLVSKGCIYYLYGSVPFGFQKIAALYWNGKTFVKIACDLKNKDLVEKFLNDHEGFVL